jgi:polyisoprenoid-binding protein YceI
MVRFLLASALALSTAGIANAATYKIDPRHAQVHFTYLHQGYAHLSARLNQLDGSVEFDPANPGASSIQVTLPMSSLSTGVPKLDTHLLSADFFDAEKFPTASFRSTKVEVVDAKHLSVTGDLTIHGVTRPVQLAVTINRVGEHSMTKAPMAGFEATTTIKRSDFGVTYMAQGVADEVELRINIETSVPKPEPAPAPAAAKG